MSELSYFLRTRKKANLAIVIINIVIFIVLSFMGNTEDALFMYQHGACYLPAVQEGEYYRLFTSMFLHFSFPHIAYNMLSLIYTGDMLETVVGSVRYLIIYLAGGICGNIFSLAIGVKTGDYAVSAGASGAIFAVMGALLYIALRNRKRFGNQNTKKLILVVSLMLMQGMIDKGVDGYAHLGGMIGGFILAVLLYHKKKRSFNYERL